MSENNPKELPILKGVYDPTDKSLPELPDAFKSKEQLAKEKADQDKKAQAKQRLEQKRKKQLKAKKAKQRKARSRDEEEEQDSPGIVRVGAGCARTFLNCRCLGCGGLLVVALAIIIPILVFVAKPPAVWEPLKDFLNVDLEENPHDGTTLESAITELEFQIRDFNVGENRLVISESQLKPLINERLKDISVGEIHTDLEVGSLKLYWDTVPTEDSPLWVVIELESSSDRIPEISSVGFERVKAPGLVNDTITRLVLTTLNITGVSDGTDLITVLVPLPDNVTVTGVEFTQDTMTIVMDVSTGLESILQF